MQAVGHRHFLVVLASSEQLLPRINTHPPLPRDNGSHDGLVQTESKLPLPVDGLMMPAYYILDPTTPWSCLQSLCCAAGCCFCAGSDACSRIRTNLRGRAGLDSIGALLLHTQCGARAIHLELHVLG